MSCNLCTTKFNFFHKEVGCSNCGLSFCNKCLKQKCKIPNKGNLEYNVCKTCYMKLTDTSSSSALQNNIVIPPDVFIKRLECLENPAAPPITVYKNNEKLQNLRSGLSPVDQQLLDRLEKLKDKAKGPPPSEFELRRRLADLKGENTYVEGPSKLITHSVDMETDQQKVDNLLEQFVNERDIEFSHNPQEEIEARLATLREKGVRPNEGPYVSNLHDSSSSEEEMERITKKIMDEVALEDRCFPMPDKEMDSKCQGEDVEGELPWCILCNEDAAVRCLDCGGDLYCIKCNKEAHKSWGDDNHRVIEYKRK